MFPLFPPRNRTKGTRVLKLDKRSRLVRLGVTIAMGVAVLAGTLWGQDDHFPVGPFRMYSIANKVDGRVATVTFSAKSEAGSIVEMRPELFGLRPAEIEGHLPELIAHPARLEDLVLAYERVHDDGERIVKLQLIEEARILEAGKPVASERRVLAEWSRS